MAFMGIIIALGTLFLFTSYLDHGIEKALTISLTTLAIFQWFNAWNCRNESKSVFTNPFENKFLVGATIAIIALQIFAVHHPFMQQYLHTVPLTVWEWAYIALIASSILWLEEARKFLARATSSNL
jgi:Ca2+-transporting ATPase